MTTYTLTLNDVLNRLMFQERLRVTELSRRTGVPQATLQRIVMGTIEKPRQASLQPIADYFKVSIEQLKGLQPISWLSPTAPEEIGWTEVPLLAWDEVAAKPGQHTKERGLYTDVKLGGEAFAVTVKDASMEPLFPLGTLLILDRSKIPADRDYVVAMLKDYPQAIFRQLVLDGPHRYLKPISPDFENYSMNLMSEDDTIIGVLVQTRRNY
jgi:SOS-response transcriptional repressor LexA